MTVFSLTYARVTAFLGKYLSGQVLSVKCYIVDIVVDIATEDGIKVVIIPCVFSKVPSVLGVYPLHLHRK